MNKLKDKLHEIEKIMTASFEVHVISKFDRMIRELIIEQLGDEGQVVRCIDTEILLEELLRRVKDCDC